MENHQTRNSNTKCRYLERPLLSKNRSNKSEASED